ncbi:toxin-antitoxin system YwqK family antitoxin [Hymenobacter siberiensis]|uniref:toxin-antitoxin system YwqK family antitoxin n=1 Tax=Hymenobacter siberiensis TaxID=2848396 RepID=UPI001C1DEC92|nr:hypothetical protein [Hymenobacter siberiensis]
MCFSFCYAGCSDNQRIHTENLYFPNGKLKAAASMKGKALHGLITWYYPNGKVESISNWYESKRNGSARLYSSAGIPKEFAYYKNGVKVSTVLFDSLGKPEERRTLNAAGREVLIRNYKNESQPASSTFMPIVEANDTIVWGEKFTGYIHFGYPLKSKVTMLVGRLGRDLKAEERYPLLDTFQVVHQNRDGRFYFSFPPTHLGANTFAYKFIQPDSPWTNIPEDSLSVDEMSGSRPFFVKKPTVQR